MIVLFYLFSFILLTFALLTVLSTNLVHSSLLMIGAFVATAVLFILLDAQYIAGVQILVYVGAITILLVFGVMLTRKGNISESNLNNRYTLLSFFSAIVLFIVLILSILKTNLTTVLPTKLASNPVVDIAKSLLMDYSIAFEIMGLLLLISIIGAIIIGKESK